MIIFIQIVSIVILLVGAIYLINNWRGKEHTYLVLFCLVTMINNIGALVEIVARDKESILLGTKFAYVGKVFIPLTFFLFIMQYCRIEIPKKIKLLLTFFHMSIAVMVFTYPMQHWFYTDVEYSTEGLFPHNNYGHGVMYNIYTVSLVLYFIIILTVVLAILVKERRKKRKIQMLYMLACVLCAMAGFVVFLLGWTGGYDSTSLSYAIATIFMAIALAKYDLIDTVELARNYVIDNLSLGIIALDEDERIIYSNEPLKDMYPDFGENGDAIVRDLILKSSEKKVVAIEDKVYRPKYRILTRNGKERGHILTLNDITDNYSYTQLMKKMTETDTLTGLFNRFAYEYRISEMKKNGNQAEHLILFVMDVNGLKTVNDTKGHDVGDSMIYDAAQCILQAIGDQGTCYRVGGDEFAALVAQKDADPERIKNNIKAIAEKCQKEDYNVSIAIGYARVKERSDEEGAAKEPQDGYSEVPFDDIEKLADKRMYQDKENYYLSKGVNRRTKEENYRVLCDSYIKILKANLQSGEIDIIKMDVPEKGKAYGFSHDLQTWIKDFVDCGMVHEEDKELFLKSVDLQSLCRQFLSYNSVKPEASVQTETSVKPVRIFYRRKIRDIYHKVMLEIVPSNDYSMEQPIVYMYVKDVNDL
ncbi:MAG: histidine kinase N-terminal 7TM domain-containing protein [Lachnospiraceae bacterium]